MNYTKALQIAAYQTVPRSRPGQLEVLSIAGITTKLQGKPLNQVSDQQLYRVAQNYIQRANKFLDQYEREMDEEVKLHSPQREAEDRFWYHSSLLHRLGFTNDHAFTTEELEGML